MTLQAIQRQLASADAPDILQALFRDELGQASVEALDGCTATVTIDLFQGQRTAIAEYTNAGTLCRFEATDTEIIFSCFSLGEDRDLLNATRVSLDDIVTGSPGDIVSEFLERIH